MLKLTQFLRKIEVKYIISVVYSAPIFFIYIYICIYKKTYILKWKIYVAFPVDWVQ